MSQVYSRQQIRSSRSTQSEGGLSYQRHFPHFDLNSRAVKLPPIIKNDLLVGRVGQAVVQTNQGPSHTGTRPKETLTVSFPNFPDALSQKSQNGSASLRHKTESKKVPIKHVEEAPINFPNSYTVLPPIGKTSSWSTYNGYSSLHLPTGNGGKVQMSAQDKMKSQRKTSSQRTRSDHRCPPPSPTTMKSSDPAINRKYISTASFVDIPTAVENQNQNEKLMAVFVSDTSTARATTNEDTISDNELPSLSNEDIQVTEFDSVHVLEKLELTKEAEKFLESEHSKRRPATCIETDPSLKNAVDIIRDNLLRQTMEELCMMW